MAPLLGTKLQPRRRFWNASISFGSTGAHGQPSRGFDPGSSSSWTGHTVLAIADHVGQFRRTRTFSGIVRPVRFAVFRLTSVIRTRIRSTI